MLGRKIERRGRWTAFLVIVLFARPALAEDPMLPFMLGDLLGSEKGCGMAFDQEGVRTFVESRIPAGDLKFLGHISGAARLMETNMQSMTQSQKTAHCAQAARLAVEYGLVPGGAAVSNATKPDTAEPVDTPDDTGMTARNPPAEALPAEPEESARQVAAGEAQSQTVSDEAVVQVLPYPAPSSPNDEEPATLAGRLARAFALNRKCPTIRLDEDRFETAAREAQYKSGWDAKLALRKLMSTQQAALLDGLQDEAEICSTALAEFGDGGTSIPGLIVVK